MIIGVLRWGWVEVILRVSLEVILLHLLRHCLWRLPLANKNQSTMHEIINTYI